MSESRSKHRNVNTVACKRYLCGQFNYEAASCDRAFNFWIKCFDSILLNLATMKRRAISSTDLSLLYFNYSVLAEKIKAA